VYLKVGRYGPYVQLGDGRDGSKPKMASLIQGTELKDVDLDHAVKLLSLPRTLGEHQGEPVIASNGRFGPFVKCGEETRSLPADVSPIDVSLEEALELLSQPKTRGRAGSARKQTTLKDLGEHPESKKQVKILNGRYGAYITDGEVNATVPRGTNPLDVTIDRAVELLKERLQKMAETGGAPAKKATRGRTTAKRAGSKSKSGGK
jgi:DNA topoisomerase-1